MGLGKSVSDKYLVLKVAAGCGIKSRVGIVTSKKVGGAVDRNLVRRRLRAIFQQVSLRNGWDVVVIARHAAGDAQFMELRASVLKQIGRIGILSTENEKDSALVN
ncbi:ribonuclease P protein component [Dehalogenimonas sp. WBC-2]|nr:ribonuclease P protein component [Dehalogenimonas sp. WBC-2]